MINTLKIFNDLKQTMDPTAAEKIVDVIGSVYEELRNSVTKTEFNELKEIVRELAERVSDLTKRVDTLTIRMDELTQRVGALTIRMDELTQRVGALTIRMDELTQRVGALTIRMDELTVNVSRLEHTVEDLVGEMKRMKVTMHDMKQEIGGLSHTVGYRLEDEAMKSLPSLLKRDFSIDTEGTLVRDYIEIGPKKYVELNIWGHGLRSGKPVEIIGEAKSQLKKKDVDQFLQTLKILEPLINKPIVPLLVTYQTSVDVRRYIQGKNIALYFSYQL
jgi:predicted nuclease with TOPRIM domain